MDKETLTIEEIAEILHIKPSTMHSTKWKQRTGCPLRKIGKRLYAIASEFWKWFETGSSQFATNT